MHSSKSDFYWAIFASFVIGTLYYYNMSISIPKESNCSFSANIWTDIFAFFFGFVLIVKGYYYDDIILTIIGASIIVEHIWQLVHNKVKKFL